MAKVSIREAVNLYHVSRPTLTKHLKNGKITGVRDGKGPWKIDTSELAREYAPRANEQESKQEEKSPENAELLVKLEAAERIIKIQEEQIKDLRRYLPPPRENRGLKSWWPWKK